jgi:hypothetical protein
VDESLAPFCDGRFGSHKRRSNDPWCEVRTTLNTGLAAGDEVGRLGAKTGLMRHSKKTLFDHLIRARKQRRRNGDAKRFGGLEIHD